MAHKQTATLEQGDKVKPETKPTRRATTKAEQRAETMENILDEAEYLF